MLANFGIIEINRNKKILNFNKNQLFDVLIKNMGKDEYLMPYTGMAIIKKNCYLFKF